jgi:hypothetical protein
MARLKERDGSSSSFGNRTTNGSSGSKGKSGGKHNVGGDHKSTVGRQDVCAYYSKKGH